MGDTPAHEGDRRVRARYKAVLAVIADGRTESEVAKDWGVCRRTIHRWPARYEGDGLEGVGDVVEAMLRGYARPDLSGSWRANRANTAYPAVAVRLQLDNRQKSPSHALLTADVHVRPMPKRITNSHN
jgi:transposase-like protein